MPLSLQHRHAVLLADRTRDVRTITTVVTEALAANPETTPLDIETALRARQSWVVRTTSVHVDQAKGGTLDEMEPTWNALVESWQSNSWQEVRALG